MRTDPFTDTWLFLIGQQSDEVALGWGRWLVAGGFALLVLASIVIAIREWIEDPAQRTGRDVTLWALRALIGGMWFQGMLWKLPLFSTENGLYYWTGEEVTNAAFAIHREFVQSVLLPTPNFYILDALVFVTELTFAVSLLLGLGVRIVGAIGVAFVAAALARPLPAPAGMALDLRLPRRPHGPVQRLRGGPQPGPRRRAAPPVPARPDLRMGRRPGPRRDLRGGASAGPAPLAGQGAGEAQEGRGDDPGGAHPRPPSPETFEAPPCRGRCPTATSTQRRPARGRAHLHLEVPADRSLAHAEAHPARRGGSPGTGDMSVKRAP